MTRNSGNRAWLAGTGFLICTGKPTENATVKYLTKHMAYVKFHISNYLSVLNSSIQNTLFPKTQAHYTYVWQQKYVTAQRR